MHKIDLPIYYATSDSPGGPIIILKPDIEEYDHAVGNENGNPTVGGRIGQFIGSIILLALFLYFWFAV